MPLADYQQLVDDLVRDKDQVIASAQRDLAIAGAVARYSIDSPRLVVSDVVSAGPALIPLPADWVTSSVLRQIEWPVGEVPPALLPAGTIILYQGPGGLALMLRHEIPAGEQIRLTYTGAHALTALDDSIPLEHRRPVACLAAADLCGQLHSHYATDAEPTLGADAVAHQSKATHWRNRERDLRTQYTAAVGPAPSDRNRPASVDVALPSRDQLGGRRIFKPPVGWPRA